jgi:flavin-dependent dehydrogenase
MTEPITLIGGGLAGLTLGIGLRQRGVPVTVWEAGTYPRHRVCGEFVSGDGLGSLERLGLLEGLRSAGARTATRAAFYSDSSRIAVGSLPRPALCVSRFVMDEWLAQEFRRLGGDLRTGTRWVGNYGPGIVRAAGRRAEPALDGWRLFGLKAHARGVTLEADLEMHFTPSGYVGLCRLAGDVVNVCGLFRSRKPVPDLAARWRAWLAGLDGSLLNKRLANARFDGDSFCSVAGLGLVPRRAANQTESSIGDALTLIPPVTGNGMSMALESAELAVGPLAGFSRGEIAWNEARAILAAACDERFTSRLRWAGWLQRALFFPPARRTLILLAGSSDRVWQALFRQTR